MNLAWLILTVILASKYSTQHSTYLYLTLHLNIKILSVKTVKPYYGQCRFNLRFLLS